MNINVCYETVINCNNHHQEMYFVYIDSGVRNFLCWKSFLRMCDVVCLLFCSMLIRYCVCGGVRIFLIYFFYVLLLLEKVFHVRMCVL